jgi:hypothetical protein
VLRSDLTIEIVLPFGLSDGRGRRARSATLVPINGYGEMHGADEPNPFRAALHLLASSLGRLGRFHAGNIDPGVLGGLLPVDRDWLLVQLDRLVFGDVRYQTVTCPAESCSKRVDICLDLSTVTPPEVPAEAIGRLALPDGRQVEYRLPSASDQVALHGLPPAELEAGFLGRCTRPGNERTLGPDEVLALPDEVRAAIVREILGNSPELDMTLDLECIECKQPFRFVYDPVRCFLGELRASRPELLKEVHHLALHYHWSQSEILGLSRNLRREYLGLIEADLEQRQRGLG